MSWPVVGARARAGASRAPAPSGTDTAKVLASAAPRRRRTTIFERARRRLLDKRARASARRATRRLRRGRCRRPPSTRFSARIGASSLGSARKMFCADARRRRNKSMVVGAPSPRSRGLAFAASLISRSSAVGVELHKYSAPATTSRQPRRWAASVSLKVQARAFVACHLGRAVADESRVFTIPAASQARFPAV